MRIVQETLGIYNRRISAFTVRRHLRERDSGSFKAYRDNVLTPVLLSKVFCSQMGLDIVSRGTTAVLKCGDAVVNAIQMFVYERLHVGVEEV